LGSAYAVFMEDRKGMIRRGYLGDMVIYDKDLMKIPPEKIMKAIVGFTIFEGKVVYERKDTN
jgi:predicted amidohydrolase YtcJ